MRIAIHREKYFIHSGLWTDLWVEACKKRNLDFEEVDCYAPDILERLKDFDLLLWHVCQDVPQDMLFAHTIMNIATNMGLVVFPGFDELWHFDDKIAEMYYLQSLGAPVVPFHCFFDKNSACEWLKNEAVYPVVAKLKAGSGSSNVLLIKSYFQGRKYVSRMFGRGFSPAPNVFFKAKSQFRSAGSWEVLKKRIKRIPEFLRRRANTLGLPTEKGYVLFQDFIPNDGYDLRVAVYNGKIAFSDRDVRKNDFRASGGGTGGYHRERVPESVLVAARDLALKLKTRSMGFDFVVDNRTQEGKIIEMCYGFSAHSRINAPGYWDFDLKWHEGGTNPAEEVLEEMIRTYHEKNKSNL